MYVKRHDNIKMSIIYIRPQKAFRLSSNTKVSFSSLWRSIVLHTDTPCSVTILLWPFQTDEVGYKLFTGYILYFERQALAGVLNVSTSRNLDLGCKFAGSRQKYCCHPGCNQWQLENRQFETTQIKSMQIKIYKIYKFAGSRQKYCCRPPS